MFTGRFLMLFCLSQGFGKVEAFGHIAVEEVKFVRTATVHARIQTQMLTAIFTPETLNFG